MESDLSTITQKSSRSFYMQPLVGQCLLGQFQIRKMIWKEDLISIFPGTVPIPILIHAIYSVSISVRR